MFKKRKSRQINKYWKITLNLRFVKKRRENKERTEGDI